MSLYSPLINQEEYPVSAYIKGTGEFVGTYENAYKAARALFIRDAGSIYSHLPNPKGKKKTKPVGVKSKKTGIIYTFKYTKAS